MRILIVTESCEFEEKVVDVIPRVGDAVCLFYRPFPIVNGILFWPDESVLKNISVKGPIDAVITVK